MRLKVQDFVCLKDVDVELNDITFFIGEQASGKSLLCKLYFYFRQVLSSQFREAIVEDKTFDEYKEMALNSFGDFFPKEIWSSKDFYIEVILDEKNKIILSYKNYDFILSFNEYLEKIFKNLKNDFYNAKKTYLNNNQDISDNILSLMKYAIYRSVAANKDYNVFFEDVIYIPSARAFFSTVADNIFSLISNNINIDTFLAEFGKKYEAVKHVKIDSNKEVDTLIRTVLKKDFIIDKKDTWLVSDDGIRTSIFYASSGQQEALPLLLVLRNLLVIKSNLMTNRKSVVIEEPEAHLFPTAQKAIVDLLFLIKQQSQTKHFLVTTHSPYILSCANNALLKNSDIKVNAYYLANGTAKRIIDDEVGLIDGIDLDGVSDTIADEFDKLIHGKYDD